jgi:hypothetical protein
MVDLNTLTPYIGVALGWFLNELSHVFRSRRDDRRAISRALTDLLDIRHSVFGLRHFIDKYLERLKASENDRRAVLSFVNRLVPDVEGIHKRYDEAVDVISSFDPLLGFELRAKDSVGPLISQMNSIVALLDQTTKPIWPKIEEELLKLIEPRFDETILRLARGKSWITWVAVRRYLKRSLKTPIEIDQFIMGIASAAGLPDITMATQSGDMTKQHDLP